MCAGAPEIEVTDLMIQAGVQTYYEHAGSGWENPGGADLREALREIYVEMAKFSPSACRRISESTL